MTEIDSSTIPDGEWTRFECVVWFKSVYEERLDIAPDIAIYVACFFREGGAVMIMMGHKDWEATLGNIDGV